MPALSFTKREIAELRAAIVEWWLRNRPNHGMMFSPERENAAIAKTTAMLAEHAKDIARQEVSSILRVHANYRATNLKTARHANDNPKIWEDSTDTIIKRFTKLAAKEEKEITKREALIEKLDRLGLPAELVEFKPWET